MTVTFFAEHRASLDSRLLAKTQRVIEEVEDGTPPSSQVKIKGSKKKRVTKKNGKFKCDLCPYTTDRQQNIDRHQLTHSKERPFSCKKCKKGFTTKTNLDRHQRNCKGAGTGIKSSIKELMKKRASALNLPVPELKGVYVTPTQKYKLEKEKVAALEKKNAKLQTENLRLKREIEALKGKSEPPENEDKSPGSETEEEMDFEESALF